MSASTQTTSSPRVFLLAWAHLAVLWTMAVAQAALDVLDDSPDFFVARGNTRGDILILAFGLVLGPPTVMAAVEAAIPREPVRRFLHLGLTGLLAAAFVLQLLKDTGWPSGVLIPLAVGLGAAGAFAYARFPNVRLGLTVLAPLPLVVLFLFLIVSPVSKLILEQDEAAVASVAATHPHAVVIVVPRRDGVELAARLARPNRRHPLPELRRALTQRDLVPQGNPRSRTSRAPRSPPC